MVNFDSSFLVDFLRGRPAAVERLKRLEARRETKYVCPPAATEVLIGAALAGDSELARTEALLASVNWLPFDPESCRVAARIGRDLIEAGEPLGIADLFIAAITVRHGDRLLTRDRGFTRVKGLAVETY
ncbi:MAG: PIN domain-containing protein [Thermoplasmata archaeon]|nr:PIN domain-containing protein [Thermoplasmata archaeon]